jgi:iron complex transport system substrate-binding protein
VIDRVRRGALLTALGLALAACAGEVPSPVASAPTAGASPAASAFPVTLTHARGQVTIPAKPQRVVALGYADIAVARALHAPLVGAVAFPGGSDPSFPGVTPPLQRMSRP